VKFEYSTDDVYAIEMGDEYMRFYRNGAQILTGGGSTYEIATGFDSSELANVRWAQNGNLLYMVDGNDVPQVLTRTAHNAWTITDIAQEGGPFLNQNTDETSTIEPNATSGTVDLTATGGIFDADHVGSLWQISHIVDGNTIDGRFWGAWTGADAAGDSNSADTITVFQGQTYTVTTGGDWWGTFNIERSYDDGSTWHNVQAFASRGNYNVLYNGIELEDDALYRLTMRGQLVSGHMHRHGEGECDYTLATDTFTKNGIVTITAYSDANSVTATVDPNYTLASTDATWRWSEGMWSDYRGWPKTVTFHQQRAVYGGSDSYPTTMWFSQTGSDYFDDFYAGTGLDTDAFWVDLQGQNPIRWLLSSDYILVGTSGSVGTYGKRGLAITPTTPGYQEQSGFGSAQVQAVIAGHTAIYVERNQRKIREFLYSLSSDGYTAPELTMLSEEITDPCVVEIAFQAQPQPIIWCVLGDGDIATLTYYREQSVTAWSKQTTNGEFESLIAMPGSGTTPSGDRWTEDSLWTVVTRSINSVDTVFIENFMPVEWGADYNDCWFVDSGLSTNDDLGGAASTFTGLDHLATEDVYVYADANYIGTSTVSAGGAITLGDSYTNVTAGFTFTSKLETLPLRIPTDGIATSIAEARISDSHVTALNFDLWDTNFLKYGMGASSTLTTSDFGSDFVTNEVSFKRLTFPYGSREKPTIYVESAEPVPLGIRALIAELSYYRSR
jgi:hypothetical protein